jgi:hypothetical protein
MIGLASSQEFMRFDSNTRLFIVRAQRACLMRAKKIQAVLNFEGGSRTSLNLLRHSIDMICIRDEYRDFDAQK